MFKSRQVLAAASALMLAALLTNCSGGAPSSNSDEPYTIGAILALSGPAATLGDHELDGAKLALKEINEQGGVNGHQIKLEVQDGQGVPDKAVAAYNNLASKDSLLGVFGATFGSSTLAVNPLSKRFGMPQLAPNSTQEVGHTGNKYMFRLGFGADVEVKATADMLRDAGLDQSVAMLHTSDAYGTQGAQFFAKNEDIDFVANEQMPLDATDITAQMTKIRAADPDVILMWGDAPNVGIALKAADQLGLTDIPIISGQSAQNDSNIKVAAGTKTLSNWVVQGTIAASDPLPRQKKFVKLYAGKYDYPPDVFSQLGYDSIDVFASALESIEGEVDRDSLRDALEDMDPIEGASGKFDWSPSKRDGLSEDAVMWLAVRNKKFVPADIDKMVASYGH